MDIMQKLTFDSEFNTLSANPTKWPNTLKTIRRLIADELFEYVRPFCGVSAQRVKILILSDYFMSIMLNLSFLVNGPHHENIEDHY